MQTPYLNGYITLFKYYKELGDKSISQINNPEAYFWSAGAESNSIAVIVQHLNGNMLSRWTDFLTTDGEKEWRNRDQEFELYIKDKDELLDLWQKGWACLFEALESVQEEDSVKLVYIRQKGHTIEEAVQRQLAHYAYHIGQLVFIARMICAAQWQSLSIPKGQSQQYNKVAFGAGKRVEHFTAQGRGKA